MKDKNAPMFPTYYSDSGEGIIRKGFEPHGGISVRLYVATQILSGIWASGCYMNTPNDDFPTKALAQADALIKASRKDEE